MKAHTKLLLILQKIHSSGFQRKLIQLSCGCEKKLWKKRAGSPQFMFKWINLRPGYGCCGSYNFTLNFFMSYLLPIAFSQKCLWCARWRITHEGNCLLRGHASSESCLGRVYRSLHFQEWREHFGRRKEELLGHGSIFDSAGKEQKEVTICSSTEQVSWSCLNFSTRCKQEKGRY